MKKQEKGKRGFGSAFCFTERSLCNILIIGESMSMNGLSWASIRQMVAPAVKAKTNGKCYYCGVNLDGVFDVEHLVPQARGGTHALKNLVPSCKPCNSEKGQNRSKIGAITSIC
ncbi:hypothetical protein DEA98_22375 [Brucella pseudogrignonensis]|nr:hypothetical protein [Brucella pseudogrignonensis]